MNRNTNLIYAADPMRSPKIDLCSLRFDRGDLWDLHKQKKKKNNKRITVQNDQEQRKQENKQSDNYTSTHTKGCD